METARPGATADAIERLAPKCAGSARLNDLADTLRALGKQPAEPERAMEWATVDLFATFLGRESALRESGQSARLWAGLDTARRVLILVPVLVTWIGLAWAGFVYKGEQAAGTLRGEAFFEGWLTGFHGQLPGLVEFSPVMLVTTFAVFLVILGNIVLIFHRRVIEKEQADLREQLGHALIGANQVLAQFRREAQGRMANELAAAAGILNGTVDAIATVGDAAGVAQQRATDTLAAAVAALTKVTTATDALTAAADGLDGILDRISGDLDRHLADMRGQSAEYLDKSVEAADQLNKAVQHVATAQQALNSAVGDSSGQLADVLRSGAGEIRASIDDVSSVAAAYAHRMEVAADILGLTQNAIKDQVPAEFAMLRADITSLRDSVAALGDAVTAMNAARQASGNAPGLLRRRQPGPPPGSQ